MSLLYPWMICNSGCLWWNQGREDDFCNFGREIIEDHTGRPGCFYWQCAGCGESWDSGDDHSCCQVPKVELFGPIPLCITGGKKPL